jgi:hypothetical protein
MLDADYQLVRRFQDRYGPFYPQTWRDDGSDIAALIAISSHVEPMIFNGGWPSVFYNRGGGAVPAACRGYRLLGLAACAERCELAMSLCSRAEAAYSGRDHTDDEWFESTLMQTIDHKEWDALDDGWFDLTSTTVNRIARFIRDHHIPVN